MTRLPEFQSLLDVFEHAVVNYDGLTCLDFQGYSLTYKQVSQYVNGVASGLTKIGVQAGDHVGLCLPNTPYSVVCYYAILKLGAVVVNYNPLYSEQETKAQFIDSETSYMISVDLKITADKLVPLLDEPNLKGLILFPFSAVLPTIKSYLFRRFKKDLIAELPSDLKLFSGAAMWKKVSEFEGVRGLNANRLAVLQYTGGTTGSPKGAMLSHFNLGKNVSQCVAWLEGFEPGEDCFLCVIPLFHIFAMTAIMNVSLAIGAKIVLMPRFEIKQLFEVFRKHKITGFPGIPPLYTAILESSGLNPKHFRHLKHPFSGGAPLSVELRKKFYEKTGVRIYEGYGLSETAPVLTIHPRTVSYKEGSIGPPVEGTKLSIRSLEASHDPLPIGQIGEIWAKGPQVMLGYWKKPMETSEVLVDGWFRTGDLGYCDSEGYYYITDRVKDVIFVNGYNVYPRNIEETLMTHPAVLEVVVIGIVDGKRGEIPKAFVRKHAGHEHVSEAELIAHCKDQLSRFAVPRQIEFRDELPKTLVGKLSKKALREEEAINL